MPKPLSLSFSVRPANWSLYAAGRITGKVSSSVARHQLGVESSKARLRELAEQTLAEFALGGVID